MKKIIVLLLMALLLLSPVTVLAQSTTQESSAPTTTTARKKSDYIDGVSVHVLDVTGTLQDFEKQYIVTFDVSDDGRMAVGLDNWMILVCDAQQEIQLAIGFSGDVYTSGRSKKYHVNWCGENLELINVSGRQVVVFDSLGNVVDAYYRELTDDPALQEEWDELRWRDTVTVNGSTYTMRKSTWFMKCFTDAKHDQLIRTDASENEEFLFDSTSKFPKEDAKTAVTIIVVFGIFLPCFIVFIIISTKRRVRECIAHEKWLNSLKNKEDKDE